MTVCVATTYKGNPFGVWSSKPKAQRAVTRFLVESLQLSEVEAEVYQGDFTYTEVNFKEFDELKARVKGLEK